MGATGRMGEGGTGRMGGTTRMGGTGRMGATSRMSWGAAGRMEGIYELILGFTGKQKLSQQ